MKIKTNKLLGIFSFAYVREYELKDGYIICQWKALFGLFNHSKDIFKADRAVFCDTGSGLFGKKLFFGGLDKTVEDHRSEIAFEGEPCWNLSAMDIEGLKKADMEAIQKYLIDNGAKFADNEATEFTSKFPIFKPLRWFQPREILRLGEEGIFHKVKTINRTKTSYIPYEDLKVFSGSGAFGKKLTILGDVSVITKERFSKQVYKELKGCVEKRSKVLLTEGKLYRPALLSFKKRNKYILILDEGFIVRNKSEMYYFDYNDIDNYGFEKKRWWSLFGKFWCIANRDDARDASFTTLWDNSSSHEFEVPGIPFWKWRILLIFRGSLKRKLKRNCKKAKEQAKRIAKEAKKQDKALWKKYVNDEKI